MLFGVNILIGEIDLKLILTFQLFFGQELGQALINFGLFLVIHSLPTQGFPMMTR